MRLGAAASAGIPAAAGVPLPGAALGGISPALASAAVSATAVSLIVGLGTAIAIFPPNTFADHQFEALSVIFKEDDGNCKYKF